MNRSPQSPGVALFPRASPSLRALLYIGATEASPPWHKRLRRARAGARRLLRTVCLCSAPTVSEVNAFAQAAALLERHHGSTVPLAARAFLVEHVGDMAPRATQEPSAGWTCNSCGFWHPDVHAKCGKWCSSRTASVPKPPALARQPTNLVCASKCDSLSWCLHT